ncbi:hypothetical protein ISN44_As08g024140 [Arabidopsis suecica]|uniref:Replication protein A 70 kDa DNA-binding subunit B/D first OB fold domain-containing protein n=1 Tax=Arabidopsis suecica TaxID=45249 RepID=A0A8T2B6G4_ARASU|nr:hypothetical protein ISN44_As08g024140 [Arabidopsis suecica]
MAITPFKELEIGRQSQSICGRLLRKWQAKSFHQNGKIFSLDFLLLDQQSTLIQVTIPQYRAYRFRDDLHEEKVYNISEFQVDANYGKYKLTDHLHVIKFLDGTIINPINPIPNEMFRFRQYNELWTLAGTNHHLPDVVGELTKIQGSNLEDLSCDEKITLYLLLADGKNVSVMVWDACALEFRKLYATIVGKATILIITAVNPKSYGGT